MRKNNFKILLIVLALFLVLTGCGEDNETHVHTEVIKEGSAATCTKTGLTIGMYCSTCKEVLVEQVEIPMLEHTYIAATCENPATCSVCGATNGGTLDHEFGDWQKVSDTEEKRECKNCDHSEIKAIAHTHSYGSWEVTTNATCTATGVESRKCSCGEEETRVISALNHSFDDWYKTSDTEEKRECKNCDYFETRTVSSSHTHSYGAWSVNFQATCTTIGMESRKCSCGDTETRTISATGHSFDDWYKTSDTEEKRECQKCNYFETRTVSSSHTHSYGAWSVTTKATCTTTGVESRKCSCGDTETRIINATGHSFGEWYVSVPATQTTNGTEKRECNNCDHFETKSIPATGGGSTTDTNALLQADLDAISLPTTLTASYKYTNTGANGTKFTYLSSNAGVLDDEGNVTRMLYDVDVTVKVIGTLNGVEKEKQVTIKVLKYELPEKTHQIILDASDFPVPDNSSTFKKGNGYIELNTNKVNNYFYCGEGEEYIAPKPFTGLVVSWGAIDTSSTAKVTVDIKLRVNGTWSDYVSYGAWGFEGTNGNASKTDSTGLIKISTDEISVLNGKTADAIRYKVNLSRSSASAVSPKIKYLSFAFDYSSYSYSVNRNHLPESVFYNVPKRYQLDVAGDGNVMCSATSTTMMLEYHGINLTSKASAYGYTYPQEYIARKVVRDVNMSGGGFGNWVYNTVSMSHYGFKSYVARYYSIEELMYDLTKGPVALSIKKCTMTQYENYKTYTHSGHIIVAVGYKYINGQLYITCNDPYVSQVTCNYSATLITNNWKYIGYVIEK